MGPLVSKFLRKSAELLPTLDIDGAVLQQRHAVLRRDDHLLDGDAGQQRGQHLLAQFDVVAANGSGNASG